MGVGKRRHRLRQCRPIRAVAAGDRLESDVLAFHPDVVVVAAGINDRSEEAAKVQEAAAALFDRIRASGAELIVVSPWWPRESDATIRAEANAIREATGDAPYIDALGWIY